MIKVEPDKKLKRGGIEDSPRETADPYAITTRTSMDGFVVVDLAGSLLDVNEAYCRMVGFSREELLKMSVRDLEAQHAPQEIGRHIQTVIETGSDRLESRHRRKDGSLCDVEVSMSFWSGPGRILVFLRDITERKRAEEALRSSESFLNSVIEQSPLAIWVSDPKGTLIRLNQACRDMLRISDDEVVGKYNVLQDNIVEEQGLLPQVRRVFEHGETVRFEITYDTSRLKFLHLRRASFVILDTTVFPIKDSAGRIVNAVIQHQDITERKLGEEALQESAEQHAIITRTSMDGFALHDLDGNILDVNEAYCRMLGYGRDELLKKSVRDIDVRMTPQEIARRFQTLQEIGSDRLESRHRRKDGSLCDVEVSMSFWSGPGRILAFLRDITERKRAEEALRESEERFRRLFENATIGLYRTTPDGHIMLANPALVHMLGFDSADELGRRDLAESGYAPEYPRREFKERIEREGIIRGLESAWKRKDGSIIFVRESARLTRDENGRPLYYEGTVEDITERKLAEIQLQEQLDELRRWHAITLGREMRLIELKREVNELLARAGQPPRYPSTEVEEA